MLKLSHVNCRSLYKKIAQVNLLFKDADILCCSETWLCPSTSDSIVTISGKTLLRCDRITRGGGIYIYVNAKLAPYCKIDTKSTYSSLDLEIISIDLTKPCLKYMKIVCVYGPPRGDVRKCVDKLTEILSRRENYKREIWLLGDFNVDYLKRSENGFKIFQTFLKTFGLTQLITSVTRPGINSGSCLDWIITNSRFVCHVCVTNIFLSDHFAVDCIRKKAREKHKNVTKILRDYKKYNRVILIDLLKQRIDLDDYRNNSDPNVMWELVYNNVNELLSVMCPFKKYIQ